MLQKLRSLESNFSIGQATAVIAFLSLVSRLFGFVRQYLFAGHFGLGDTLDIYVTAFRIPDTVFNLLVLGTLSVAFVPVFAGMYHKNKEDALRLANSILNIAVLGISIISIGLFIFAEPLTHILVPGFSGQKLIDTVFLTRLLLISPIIFTISNVFSSMLISWKKFIAVNVAAILYNIGIIFGLFFFYPYFGLLGLAFGVFLGAGLHGLVQFREVLHNGFKWKLIFDTNVPEIKTIAKLFLPRVFGLDISFVSLLVASFVGSLLSSGSVAAYTLANDLQAVPLGIIALSTAVALFPILSESFSKHDHKRFIEQLGKGIVQILLIIIPLSIGMLLLRAQIVRLVYGHGKVDWVQTTILFNALGAFTISLFAQSLTPLLARAFYARQNTKTPVIIGLFCIVVNASLSYLLSFQYGVMGIVIGFSIASMLNAAMLFLALRLSLSKEKQIQGEVLETFDLHLFRAILKIIVASVLMGVVTYGYLYLAAMFINTRTVIGIIIQSGVATLAGAMAYTLLLYWFDFKEVRNLVDKFTAYFKLK